MASVQGIYLALFGRPADPAGLAYFNGITNNGANLEAIGNLSGQQEYLSRFNGMSNEQIVTSIYQSLFGRDPEKAGLDFYVGELAAGRLSVNTIAINILDGAAGADKATVDVKIAAANLFTSHLDTPAEIAAYNGAAAAQLARTFINGINSNNPGSSTSIDSLIQSIQTSAGQAPGGNDSGGGGGGGSSSPAGEKVYSGDVLLLNNDQTLKSYQYSDFKHGIQEAVMEVAAATRQFADTNVVLINDMTPINLLIGQQLAMVTGVVEQIPGLESYHEWQPDSLFLNVFNKDSTITGTSGNDVILALGSDETSHTVTGGRGNDLIVVGGINGSIGLPGIGALPIAVTESPTESEDLPTIGSHTVDGGAGEDIIVNIGGHENILNGGSGNDVIVSLGNSKDTISGGDGDDFIFGGGDHVHIIWQRTAATDVENPIIEYSFNTHFENGDVLSGGAGSDTFLYVPEGKLADSGGGPLSMLGLTSNGADTIKDFKTGEDHIGIFVADSETIGFKTGSGFADFDAAASAAQTAFIPVVDDTTTQNRLAVDTMQFFFAADVGGDGYLFVDDNADQNIDFVIKLEGLTSEDQFSASDIQDINVYALLSTIGMGPTPDYSAT